MYTVVYTSRMKKDVRRIKKRGKDISKLIAVLNLLSANDDPLPERYHDHQLEGDFKNLRECHIEPDWLLLYRKFKNKLILSATATGTHKDLFDK